MLNHHDENNLVYVFFFSVVFDSPPPLLPFSFEIAIFVLIFLNMLTMGIEHYDQPHAVFFILEVSNAFFTTVFGLGNTKRFETLSIFSRKYSAIVRLFVFLARARAQPKWAPKQIATRIR